MLSLRRKFVPGMTFVEILIAVAVLLTLITIVVGVSNHIDTQGKQKLTEAAIGVVVTALEQYYDFWEAFPFDADESYDGNDFLAGLHIDEPNAFFVDPPGYHDPCYASSEALYYALNKTPASRKVISNLPPAAVTGKDQNGQLLKIDINGREVDLLRFVDSWNTSLRYTFDADNDVFPFVRSAGPDRQYRTKDDITSRTQ